LPIQIIDLAANGHALSEKQASETSVKLRKLAADLKLQATNIETHIGDLQL
jgi:hypothetical protein